MINYIYNFFKNYWQKLAMILLLALGCWLFQSMTFNTLEFLIRDSLQYLNSTKNIDKSIVTLNINTFTKHQIKHPHTIDTFKKVIDRLQQAKPRAILIMMEPFDLSDSKIEKKKIYKFLYSQRNVYLNSFNTEGGTIKFSDDEVFKSFPRLIFVSVIREKDRRNRKEVVYYYKKGESEHATALKEFGLKPIEPSFFKYTWSYWETKQIYLKKFKLGTFGYLQSDDLLDNKISDLAFKDKVVIIGTHDEWSFLQFISTFNLFNKKSESMMAFTEPIQDALAGIFNAHLSGDYVKFLENVSDMHIVFFLLLFLIIINIRLLKKMYIYLSIIPAILVFETVLYATSSFYIDFSRSIAFLFFTQYLAVPIVMFNLFKSQEKRKLQEINDTRIDSLLLISEKVAHDIRSPLSAINLVLSKVKIDNPEYKEILNNSLKRIDETADKILTRYRSTSSSNNEIFESISLVNLIKPLVQEKKLLDPKIQYNLIDFKDKTASVIGHKLELERILSNILDNAIFALKNKDSNAEIKIEILKKNDQTVVCITDNGTGIPSSILTLLGKDRITTKVAAKGNGIGLLHAKRVIERMNGSFEIESIESQFTTVSITLKST